MPEFPLLLIFHIRNVVPYMSALARSTMAQEAEWVNH